MKVESFPQSVARTSMPTFALLLRNVNDLNETNDRGRSAVFEAARLGRTQHLELLVVKGADVNLVDNSGESPLQIASRHGHADAVEVLLNAGANLNYCNRSEDTEYCETALGTSVRKGHKPVFDLLCAQGADPNLPEGGKTPLHLAAGYSRNDFANPLIGLGSHIGATDMAGDTALHKACAAINLDFVKILLEAGAPINSMNKRGETPLHCALRYDKRAIDVVRALLTMSPDLSIRDNVFKCTAPERSVSLGIPELADLFGATIPESTSEYGFSVAVELTPEEAEEHHRWSEELGKNGPYLFVGTNEYKKALHDLVPELDLEEKEELAELNRLPARPFQPAGWEASPRHGRLLESLKNGPKTLERMAAIARGSFGEPSCTLSDGNYVFGESYWEAATRFEQLGLIEKPGADVVLDLSFTSEEIREILKSRGDSEKGAKAERIARLLSSKEDGVALLAEVQAKDVFQLTDQGHAFLMALGESYTNAVTLLRNAVYSDFSGSTNFEETLNLIRNLIAAQTGALAGTVIISERAIAEFAVLSEKEWEVPDPVALEDPDAALNSLMILPSLIHRLAEGRAGSAIQHLESLASLKDFQEVGDIIEELKQASIPGLRDVFDRVVEAVLVEELSKSYKLYDLGEDCPSPEEMDAILAALAADRVNGEPV